jgi:hypothetical protein
MSALTNATIRRAYADWSRPEFGKHQQNLAQNGITLIQVTRFGAQQKNAADILMAVASIVLGAGLLLGNGARTRLDALKVELATNHELANKVADLESSGSGGAQALVGVAAIVLGILALVGVSPANLVLVSMLAIGAATLLSGSAIESRMVNMILGR